jgi:hypothetical protein
MARHLLVIGAIAKILKRQLYTGLAAAFAKNGQPLPICGKRPGGAMTKVTAWNSYSAAPRKT